jgi:oxalate decarboxylase/phosphoglucose isomerase-like protein (cupin superfamily)
VSKVFRASLPSKSRLQESPWGTMLWLVEDALIGGADLSVARMTLKAGACAERHGHPNCNEVIHLIQGSVEQSVGDEQVAMQAGDTVFIPRGSLHRSRNVGRGEAIMLVSYSAGERIYEAVRESQTGER